MTSPSAPVTSWHARLAELGIRLPAVAATGLTLRAVGAALGTRSPSEEAARRRIARVTARTDVAE